MKFLIDECLSVKLANLAHDHGYGESSHIAWLDLSGTKDWVLLPIIVGGDWTFVTRNSIDFRGPASSPGSRGQYTRVDLHAGLVCLNGPDGLTRDLQIELFGHALRELAAAPDLINQVLEITLEVSGDVRIVRYGLPDER